MKAMATKTNMQPTDRKPRPGKFVWFEHASGDARKAQAFYGEVLGWKVEPWGDSGYDMILAGDTIDTMIGGYTVPGEGQKAHWVSYVSVEDVDAAARAAVANGGRIIEAAHDLPGVGRAATIADAQGAELCLFKNNEGDPADAPMSEPPPPRRFFWSELHTTDPANALSFYERVVGFTHETMNGPGGAYHILSRGGVGRGGVTGHLSSGMSEGAPHWLPYVAVEDPDATIAHARKLGAKIHAGPADIPGIGRFGVLEDPTGAVLAVMKALPPTASHGI
jgi:predicted enzyme related to lactoylglutathione lyase